MSDKTLIKSCRIYDRPDFIGDILIEDGKISEISNSIVADNKTEVIEARRKVIIPGLIDVHIQGAGGHDVLDGNEDALQKISSTLAETGTTSFLGTTVVKPKEENRHLKFAKEYVGRGLDGAKLLGFHLEGPFINEKKKGGLDPASIYTSSRERLKDILDVTGDTLKMMTIAPELDGNLQIISELRKNNVVAAFAHSDADYKQTKAGFDAGINHVTHIFNAMRSIHHREPGPIPAIFENDKISVQIISDGHHINPAVVKMIYNNIGAERCICITDGMQGIGLPEGKYIYNGKEYISKDGAARYLDGTLIGSTMSLLEIVFKFKEFTGCTLEEAVNSATKIPAELLNVYDRKGSIEKGKDADLVLLNEDNSIAEVFVKGNKL